MTYAVYAGRRVGYPPDPAARAGSRVWSARHPNLNWNKGQLEMTPPHPSTLSLSRALHHRMRDNESRKSKKSTVAHVKVVSFEPDQTVVVSSLYPWARCVSSSLVNVE